MLVGQPTRGVDIGAIEFIHAQIIALKERGCAVLLVSVELDEILARKYDENTPTGGIPACGSQETGAPTCAGPGLESGENINNESTLDDVDDFDGFSDTPYPGYTRTVSVSQTGNAKQVTVTVSGPNNQQLALSAFRANF